MGCGCGRGGGGHGGNAQEKLEQDATTEDAIYRAWVGKS